MSKDDSEMRPLANVGSDAERWLLAATELDEPPAALTRQTVDLVLTSSRNTARRRRQVLAAGAAALALAASALLFIQIQKRSTPAELRPEPVASISGTKARKPASLGDPCVQAAVANGRSPLIDDLEDGNARIASSEQRNGTWFVENDATGSQRPAPGEPWHPVASSWAEGGRFALRTTGGGFKTWGAAAGVHLANGGCYDASAYTGVRFAAKGPGRVTLIAQMIDVVPTELGGTCKQDCFANHGKAIELGSDWQRYAVPWDELAQPGYGTQTDFDPSRLRSILFLVEAPDSPFDFWIDDVSFVDR